MCFVFKFMVYHFHTFQFGPSPKNEMCEEHRLKKFSNSADLAVALLASATCGISGLPFKFQDEDGKEQEVADGASALLEIGCF